MKNGIQKYRDQFLMITECKDQKIKNRQLGMLMTEMELEYNITMIKDDEFNIANPVVIALYQDISNARIF